MSERYTSIKIVLDRLLRHPLMQDLTLETAVDYIVDFMRIVGVPRMFVEKVSTIQITSHKGKIPCDWYNTIQVKDCNNKKCLRYATDNFMLSEKMPVSADSTFMIQGNYIYTSIKEGEIEMSYSAIDTDEDGFPMIPDNSVFLRAVEEYIKKQWFTILFEMGKVPQQVLQAVEQRYAWAVGACETEFQRMDLSKAESFFNSFRTLIVRDHEFRKGFTNNGTKEMIKIH